MHNRGQHGEVLLRLDRQACRWSPTEVDVPSSDNCCYWRANTLPTLFQAGAGCRIRFLGQAFPGIGWCQRTLRRKRILPEGPRGISRVVSQPKRRRELSTPPITMAAAARAEIPGPDTAQAAVAPVPPTAAPPVAAAAAPLVVAPVPATAAPAPAAVPAVALPAAGMLQAATPAATLQAAAATLAVASSGGGNGSGHGHGNDNGGDREHDDNGHGNDPGKQDPKQSWAVPAALRAETETTTAGTDSSPLSAYSPSHAYPKFWPRGSSKEAHQSTA